MVFINHSPQQLSFADTKLINFYLNASYLTLRFCINLFLNNSTYSYFFVLLIKIFVDENAKKNFSRADTCAADNLYRIRNFSILFYPKRLPAATCGRNDDIQPQTDTTYRQCAAHIHKLEHWLLRPQ